MLNGKDTITHLIAGQTKKTVQMTEYFPNPKSLNDRIFSKPEIFKSKCET